MKHPLFCRKFLILLFWLAVWQIAGLSIHNEILLVGPVDVVLALARLVVSSEFWFSITHSFARITLGFFTAFFCGIFLGSLAYRFPLLKDFLEPVIQIMKAVPVASFVILALIWTGSKNLSVLISFLVVFPVIYVNTIAGLGSTDPKMLEMAQVFQIPIAGRIRCIYLPALLPYLISSCEIALGMSWKSGVAAEVIGIPAHSIGERLYMAKIYLETADVFAWTIVIILVSAMFERLVLWIIKKGGVLL
jgi:NitT/TauT family transport system permease protein